MEDPCAPDVDNCALQQPTLVFLEHTHTARVTLFFFSVRRLPLLNSCTSWSCFLPWAPATRAFAGRCAPTCAALLRPSLFSLFAGSLAASPATRLPALTFPHIVCTSSSLLPSLCSCSHTADLAMAVLFCSARYCSCTPSVCCDPSSTHSRLCWYTSVAPPQKGSTRSPAL